jgi:hypothetical protein
MDATVPLYNSKLCSNGSCPVSVLTTVVLGLRGLPGRSVAKNISVVGPPQAMAQAMAWRGLKRRPEAGLA